MRQKRKKAGFMTEVELELMSVLWALGQGSVRDVLEGLSDDRNLAYTSAATMLRIMEQKGFLVSEKQGKTFIYTPTIAKDDYQVRSVRDLSAKLFDDTPAHLVARLVDDAGLSAQELEEIRALLNRRLGDDSD